MITSVERGLCGPCCSVEPVGTRTRSPPPSRYCSTSVSFSSASKTDGRCMISLSRERLLERRVFEAGDVVVLLDLLQPRNLLPASCDRPWAARGEAALHRDVDRARDLAHEPDAAVRPAPLRRSRHGRQERLGVWVQRICV